MLAIAGGAGAAIVFATVTLCNSRSSRMIGPNQLLAWVMLIGLVITGPLAFARGVPSGLDSTAAWWMAVAGIGNVVGLLLAYSALRLGQVGVVAPIVSSQGAFAALPLVLATGLRMTRWARPLVLVSGVFEVLGFALFAFGARHGIAITAV